VSSLISFRLYLNMFNIFANIIYLEAMVFIDLLRVLFRGLKHLEDIEKP
jgi:hypothetical protein